MGDKRTDRVFKALADATRREMLDLLAARPRTTGELAEHFSALSRFAVMKHLRVLHAAGLILITRDGRRRWNRLNPVPLREVLRRWVDHQQEMWADVMLNIRDAAQGSAPPDSPAADGAVPEKK
jgi:DNA-binding transcriptional ArsR family regulator